MSDTVEQEAPVAFISYSHDSKAHKEWVRNLAIALRDQYGIDVIIDQWEIGPGDDVPKFMEHSVKRALRVLMICTDPYVRKVDDGKGGAGYEAMVVTGELVADLGTRKFIPIMRQSAESPALPACVSTRYYIDFSDDSAFQTKVEELARSIHNAPKFEKPPLGTNPFLSLVDSRSTVPAPLTFTDIGAETDTYRLSLSLADAGNFAKWRDLIHREKISSATTLLRWRIDKEHSFPGLVKKLPDYFTPAVRTHMGLFAAAFGAFDSKDKRFHNQLGLIDTLREPKGWERSGNTIFVALPDLILFTYQALMGGLALSRHNFDAALKLATTPLADRYSRRDSLPLFKSSWAMGWPESMNTTCTIAWEFLMNIIKEWTWLHELFGSEEDTRAAVCAYYSLLNTLDFISATKSAAGGKPKEREITVPLCFVMIDEETKRKAKALFFADPAFVTELLDDNSVLNDKFAANWENWITACRRWAATVYKERFYFVRDSAIFHSELPRALSPSQGKRIID